MDKKVVELLEQIVALLQQQKGEEQSDDKYRELLTADEVGSAWHKHPNFVRDLTDYGLLLGLKRGRSVYYAPEEIRAFETWWQGKDLSDLDHIIDMYTGEPVPHRFANTAEILTIPKQA